MPRAPRPPFRGFTLIELLIVVAIIAILASIAIFNMRTASRRAWKTRDMAQLRTIGIALNTYFVEHNTFPPADAVGGPFMSHTPDFSGVGDGPAAGGSWDGLPWLLHERGYVENWRHLFCPKYLKIYAAGQTLGGEEPRYHNFRYAYNASALRSRPPGQYHPGEVMNGAQWIVRDLWLPPEAGWHAGAYPDYPADYRYPWGEGNLHEATEMALYADGSVREVVGGTDLPPDPNLEP